MSYNPTLSLKDIQNSKAQEKARLVDLESQVETLLAQVDSLKGQLQTSEEKAALTMAELSECKKENQQLTETSRHLNNKILNWEQLEQERSIQRLEQFSAMEAKTSAKDAEIEKLKVAQKELNAELKKAKALNPERLNRQNKDLQKRIAEGKEGSARLSEQLRKVKAELKELKAENAKPAPEPLYRSEDGLFELRNDNFNGSKDAANSDSKSLKLYAVDAATGATVIAEGLNDADQVEWISSNAVPDDVTSQAAIIIKKMMEENEELESSQG
ncbi:hypothetical protein [Motiliproteus sp. MSK22-1]|uniref:hypothetical protein n=1 Tax=Motiliproteus sp. MSK22-1 TaxID=1897630 RepID=UPI0009761B11|nr:hypothetical protein [Motiliproteus sp. MSK22-1]OMH39767.1 hypothetical protein BGP75_01560 [Motiliproteus sp. MSK22-1]